MATIAILRNFKLSYMKNIFPKLLFIIIISFTFSNIYAQEKVNLSKVDSTKTYVITDNNGKEYIGNIISQDTKRIVIKTELLGLMEIPKLDIQDIKEYISKEFGNIDSSKTYLIINSKGKEYFGKIISQDAKKMLIKTKQLGLIDISKNEIHELREIRTDDKNNNIDTSKTFIITDKKGKQYFGKIIYQDGNDILMRTKELDLVYISKKNTREIREIQPWELVNGEYIPEEVFATRYFITTNGLPIKKGESYIQRNWYGVDLEFAIKKNLGIGFMTTWIGAPMAGTVKYTLNLNKNLNMAVGAVIGWTSYFNLNLGLGLPYASVTYGNRRSNVTISGGYGSVIDNEKIEGRPMFSVAGMTRLNNKIGFVFDSFVLPPNNDFKKIIVIIPGIRFDRSNNRAFQLGFGFAWYEAKYGNGFGLNSENYNSNNNNNYYRNYDPNKIITYFLPIPMFQWYSKF